ncbi:LysR substrate-binding domain-containing protein [Rhizobium sp. H4]|uniref:LysR substrate-binding domain-containing protein n=1 Tax=Rhizobium sp. H4 TaxID=2035449 RepID=UPI0024782767|nr:LysR substrate-binding domain-containing protein [Rhizobium sp. H4]
MTLNLFAAAGLHPHIAQVTDEKQTIVRMVAAGIGLAVVPRWTSSLASAGVRYLPIDDGLSQPTQKLPLAAAWIKQFVIRRGMLCLISYGRTSRYIPHRHDRIVSTVAFYCSTWFGQPSPLTCEGSACRDWPARFAPPKTASRSRAASCTRLSRTVRHFGDTSHLPIRRPPTI